MLGADGAGIPPQPTVIIPSQSVVPQQDTPPQTATGGDLKLI